MKGGDAREERNRTDESTFVVELSFVCELFE